ncbi:AAA family ATPase [Denitratisoma sp. agr-D3]
MRTLGGWRLEIDGSPAAGPGYRKGRGLLAFLSLEEGWHSREKLGDLLAIRSPGHLRQLLSNLRGALDLPDGTAGLLVEHNLVRLNPDYPLWRDTALFLAPPANGKTDAATLALLDAQIDLYGGEFLHGLTLPDCPDFEEWVETRRNQCQRHAVSLLDQARRLAEGSGQSERALGYARRLAELDPWNENAQRQVIRLLALAGNTAAALAQYDDCSRMLERELGVAPDVETEDLVARIRAGKLQDEQAPAAVATTERRLVTVLCCDLHLPDAEDVDLIAETLAPLRQRCQALIAEAGGHRIVSQGSRLLAYFGFPLARENAARHAVQAALAIVRETPAGVGLQLGVHSGPVIVDARAGEPDIAGVASSWAIALAEAAAPGSLSISEPTRCLVQGYFHCQALGDLSSRQRRDRLPAYRVLGETGAVTRLQSRSELGPLVGRETELAELLSLWQESRQGRHPSLLIRGDAGIGKSRLVHSLIERLGDEAHDLLEMRCHPEFSQTPFHPVLTLLSARFGFARADDDRQKQDKIAAYLAGVAAIVPAPEEALALLTDVLHLPPPANAAVLDLPPQQRKEKTGELLLSLIQGLAHDRPVLLILEDLHWCDPSTLDLLTRHVHRKFGAPVLTLITTRPGLDWQAADAILDLPPLAPDDTGALVHHLAGNLSPAAQARIVAWSDGIPLFAEEMARMAAPDHDGAQDTPLTLQELLASRLDATGPAKATAQLAAALGREFDTELLKQVSPLSAEAVDQDLARLLGNGLILPLAPGAHQFKHALIQDAAYQSLARSQRQGHHRRIAEVLAADGGQDAPPEVLARHLTLAGDLLAAIPQWLRAGRWAAAHSANQEAADHFEQGLALVAQLPASEHQVRLEFALQEALGTLRVALLGYGSQGARDCFARAEALSREVGDDAASFPVMFGLWQGGRSVNLTAAPLEFAARLDRIAQSSGDPAHRLVTDYAYGNNLFWLARYDDARHHQESALAASDRVSGNHLIAHYGEDSRILARSFLAWTLWFQGHADQARQQMERAMADARAGGHAHSLGFALTFAAVLNRHLGLPAETARLCAELGQLAEKHGLSLWLAAAATVGGWARVALGDPEGLPPILAGVAASRVAMRLVEATFRSFQVDAQLRLGQHAEALAGARETIALAESYEDVYLLPELLRLQANALAALRPDDDEVTALLRQALTTARQQGAKILALRCACDLCTVPATPAEDAQDLLAACRAECREGADTPDLQRADALLATVPG